MSHIVQKQPTPLEGMRYYTPPDDYLLSGRDGMVAIPWAGKPPIPLLEEDFSALEVNLPDYDMVGRGIYQALRLNPDCSGAAAYAAVLRDAYPHVISELGGQVIMLEAKEIDTPYLDRKINLLKIMALIDPENAGIPLEIARAYVDKGSRLASMQYCVPCWYAAEKQLKTALALNPEDRHAVYEYGEVLYVLGRYEQAAEIWSDVITLLEPAERVQVEARIAGILSGKIPVVPPLDYLTALSVAIEQHGNGCNDEAASIILDVLADPVFAEQFPLNEVYYLLGTCYQEAGMMTEAAEAFRRS
ncbi:MAG TPA: tetratricopeptide repeat protein [Desulfuromonadales bacterium]|nr:tetratricopeptide repeat protein [Desulfuromonadales bacterium]